MTVGQEQSFPIGVAEGNEDQSFSAGLGSRAPLEPGSEALSSLRVGRGGDASPSRSPARPPAADTRRMPSMPTSPERRADASSRDSPEAPQHSMLSGCAPSGHTTPDDVFGLSEESDFEREIDDFPDTKEALKSGGAPRRRSHSGSSLCTLPDQASRVHDYAE